MGRLACVAAFALAMAGACGAPEQESEPTGGDEQLPRPPVDEPAEVSEPTPDVPEPVLTTLDPDTACGQAQAVCTAFAEATPNVRLEAVCAGPAESAEADDDAACVRMRRGWCEALGHAVDTELPAECDLSD